MSKISLSMIVIFFIIAISQGSKHRTNNRYNKHWEPEPYSKEIKQHKKGVNKYKQGETVSIVCSEQEAIRVSSVQFRKRGRKACHTDSCNPKQVVQNKCNGQRSCNFTVDADYFGDDCTINKARLVLQYECILDPCLTYCCANGGQCQLTNPKGDNFDPTCMCINSYEGSNCDECDLAGTKIPCPWRNRTFVLYYNGSPYLNFNGYIPADGTEFFGAKVIEVRGSFIMTREPVFDAYVCYKIDFNQSSKDSFVYKISRRFLAISDFCTVCSVNNVYVYEEIAQDSDVEPRQNVDASFCNSPMGCSTTDNECTSDGSLDFSEGCPE